MVTRRHLLALTAIGGAWLYVGPQAWAQGGLSQQQATDFITQLGDKLVSVINGPGSYDDKKKQLRPVIDDAVDVQGIARFCLGRFRRQASPEQLSEYENLFHAVLLNNIFGKIGQFEGVTFKSTRTTPGEGGMVVGTLIKQPNQQPANAQWVVHSVDGRPKVVDVKAEGTSLRLTQRQDYASYLQRNNNDVGALITAMKRLLARGG